MESEGKAQAANARGSCSAAGQGHHGGGSRRRRPGKNSRLRLVVEQARKISMPKDTLERALKKGAGLPGETVHFEHVIYEGFAPHQVPLMVECLTDNVKRTAPEMRVLFRNGQLGTSGSVTWDFDHVGMIEAEPAAPGRPRDRRDRSRRAGLRAGHERRHVLPHRPADLDLVSRALPAQGFTVLSAKLGYKAKPGIRPAWAAALEEVEAFLAAIDAHDDVQQTSSWGWRASLSGFERPQVHSAVQQHQLTRDRLGAIHQPDDGFGHVLGRAWRGQEARPPRRPAA